MQILTRETRPTPCLSIHLPRSNLSYMLSIEIGSMSALTDPDRYPVLDACSIHKVLYVSPRVEHGAGERGRGARASRGEWGGGCTPAMHGGSRMAKLDLRSSTMPGRSTLGCHGPFRHLLVAPSAKCSRELFGESHEGLL